MKLFFFFIFLDRPTFPVPGNDVPKETRRKWLLDLCIQYVHEYLISFEVEPLVEQLQMLDEAMGASFACRSEGCSSNYVHHSMRVKYGFFIL
jgi:hypothetical protein